MQSDAGRGRVPRAVGAPAGGERPGSARDVGEVVVAELEARFPSSSPRVPALVIPPSSSRTPPRLGRAASTSGRLPAGVAAAPRARANRLRASSSPRWSALGPSRPPSGAPCCRTGCRVIVRAATRRRTGGFVALDGRCAARRDATANVRCAPTRAPAHARRPQQQRGAHAPRSPTLSNPTPTGSTSPPCTRCSSAAHYRSVPRRRHRRIKRFFVDTLVQFASGARVQAAIMGLASAGAKDTCCGSARNACLARSAAPSRSATGATRGRLTALGNYVGIAPWVRGTSLVVATHLEIAFTHTGACPRIHAFCLSRARHRRIHADGRVEFRSDPRGSRYYRRGSSEQPARASKTSRARGRPTTAGATPRSLARARRPSSTLGRSLHRPKGLSQVAERGVPMPPGSADDHVNSLLAARPSVRRHLRGAGVTPPHRSASASQ